MKQHLTSLGIRQKAEEESLELPALRVMAERAVANILHGEHARRKTGHGEGFWQFRDYQPGDRPQDIDWRQSAKADRVHVREKEWQTAQTALLWCNRSTSMDFSSAPNLPTKSEAAKVLTLALALLVTRAGEQIGFLGEECTGRSESALEQLGDILMETPPEDSAALSAFTHVKIPGNAILVQIGDFLSELDEIRGVFQRMATRTTGGLVVQVLDPAEIELPYQGRAIFEGPHGQDVKVFINHIPSIRAAYKERLQNHIESVRKICKNCHFHYLLHRTDREISATLSELWAIMHHHGFEIGNAAS